MKFSSFLLPIFFFIATFILLVLPGNEFPKTKVFQVEGLDKIVHFGVFFLLTYLFCRPFKNSSQPRRVKKARFVYITTAAIVYGVVIELIQKYLVAFRSFELNDIIVDALGAIVACLVAIRLFARKVA